MPQLSPGPWAIQPCVASHGAETVIVDPTGFVLARILSPAWDETAKLKRIARHDRANALAMAAAPNLAAALRNLLAEVTQSEAGLACTTPLAREQAAQALAMLEG